MYFPSSNSRTGGKKKANRRMPKTAVPWMATWSWLQKWVNLHRAPNLNTQLYNTKNGFDLHSLTSRHVNRLNDTGAPYLRSALSDSWVALSVPEASPQLTSRATLSPDDGHVWLQNAIRPNLRLQCNVTLTPPTSLIQSVVFAYCSDLPHCLKLFQ